MFPAHRSGRSVVIVFLVLAVVGAGGCDALNVLLFGRPLFTPLAERVGLQLLAEGLTAPVGMAIPPDGSGRKFILDQVGRIRIIDANDTLLSTPFLDLSSRMVSVGIDFGNGIIFDERGLLGLAFHPQYAVNGRFFVFYTAPKGAGQPADFDSESHISEFRVSQGNPNIADSTSEKILLVIGKPQFNHNGGQLAFGPDGKLYISVGDGGAANDDGTGHNPETGNGQDKTTLLGKLLRIDVDAGDPYQAPPDNPFVTDAAARPEIYALGLRNPWRFSFDTGGTRRLFLADVGQDLYEEMNIITRGGNYGWRVREAASCFNLPNPTSPLDSCATADGDGRTLIDPILSYSHMEPDGGGTHGIAVIGGFIYRGSRVPGLIGQLVFADWSRSFLSGDGSILAATEELDGTWKMRELGVEGTDNGRFGRFILGMGQDASGEMYVLSSANFGPIGTTGQVHRIIAPTTP